MSAELTETLAVHRRAGRKIEFLSIGWTGLESIVGIIAGLLAGSVADQLRDRFDDRGCFQSCAGVAIE